MSEQPTASAYVPPKVWKWDKPSGGTFASINRPIAGATHEKELPVGRHPLQLYSLATPNGVKVTILLEELLARGHAGAEYDAWLIRINEGDQFGSGFVGVNPNSKIPGAAGSQRTRRRSACSNPARSCCISPRSSARSCRATAARAPNACRGCSGRWAARRISAAASGTSTPTRRSRSSTRSTASRWRPSASSTCSTSGSPSSAYLAGERVHDRRHRGVALVRRAGAGHGLRRRRIPAGARVHARAALGRADRRASGGAARAHGEPCLRRPAEPAARAARGERLPASRCWRELARLPGLFFERETRQRLMLAAAKQATHQQ